MRILHHLQRVAHVTGENFLLKRLEVLPVGTVLPFAPSWPCLPRLQTPVAREHRRQNLELVAGHVHLVHLRREGWSFFKNVSTGCVAFCRCCHWESPRGLKFRGIFWRFRTFIRDFGLCKLAESWNFWVLHRSVWEFLLRESFISVICVSHNVNFVSNETYNCYDYIGEIWN